MGSEMCIRDSSMAAHKEEQYKKLAGILRENLNMDRIYGILDRRL